MQLRSDSDAVAMGETLETDVLHRSAPPPVRQACVVNDPPAADVYAVMRVEGARCDEVGREWRLLAGSQRWVVREEAWLTPLGNACIVRTSDHGSGRYPPGRAAAIAQWFDLPSYHPHPQEEAGSYTIV
jgi:hypothetical protein